MAENKTISILRINLFKNLLNLHLIDFFDYYIKETVENDSHRSKLTPLIVEINQDFSGHCFNPISKEEAETAIRSLLSSSEIEGWNTEESSVIISGDDLAKLVT